MKRLYISLTSSDTIDTKRQKLTVSAHGLDVDGWMIACIRCDGLAGLCYWNGLLSNSDLLVYAEILAKTKYEANAIRRGNKREQREN